MKPRLTSVATFHILEWWRTWCIQFYPTNYHQVFFSFTNLAFWTSSSWHEDHFSLMIIAWSPCLISLNRLSITMVEAERVSATDSNFTAMNSLCMANHIEWFVMKCLTIITSPNTSLIQWHSSYVSALSSTFFAAQIFFSVRFNVWTMCMESNWYAKIVLQSDDLLPCN